MLLNMNWLLIIISSQRLPPTGFILMVGYQNKDALEDSILTGSATESGIDSPALIESHGKLMAPVNKAKI